MARGKGLFHSPFGFGHKIMRFPVKGKAQTLGGTDEAIRTLLENINDLFYTTDTEGVVTYISPVVKTMIGYEPRDIIGRPLWKTQLPQKRISRGPPVPGALCEPSTGWWTSRGRQSG
ncbi:MAG: PAS domain S-box protein [Deltaproteobacteria bacterium]|nr:PAS domain S-box protein [Deltaproteobacteria bacterium]